MSYIGKKRVINKLIILIGLLFAFVLNIILLEVINGEALFFSKAYEKVIFNQNIAAFNPIKNVSELENAIFVGSNFSSSRYRIVTPLSPEGLDPAAPAVKKMEVSAVTTFSGEALFPNSKVFLEVNSDKFFTLVESDSNGKWEWTNYGHPLEEGEHSIEMYNISPYEISGKRDVYIDKYFFKVIDVGSKIIPNVVNLESGGYIDQKSDDNIGDYISRGRSSEIYLFNIIVPDKKIYIAGESLNLQLIFNSLGKGEHQAEISYEIFERSSGSLYGEKIMDFSDSVVVYDENSFLKKIFLKDKMIGGNYLVKVTVEIAGRKYIQSAIFEVNSKEIIKIGNVSIAEEDFEKILIWNILVILILCILFSILIVFEYKRSIWKRAVSEDNLREKGYF